MKRILTLLSLLITSVSFAQTQQGSQFQRTIPKPLEYYYGKTISGKTVPFVNTTEANSLIPITRRYIGLTVPIGADSSSWVEYWYAGGVADSKLVVKSAGGSYPTIAMPSGFSVTGSGTSAVTISAPGSASTQYLTGAGTAALNSSLPISIATQTALNGKQDALISGTNIKTVNGNSVLGSGNISISGGSNGGTIVPFTTAIRYNISNAVMKVSLSSDTTITIDTTGQVIGYGSTIIVEPNGHHVFFDTTYKKIASSGGIVDSLTNVIETNWNGFYHYYWIYQYASDASPPAPPSNYVNLSWTGKTNVTITGTDFKLGDSVAGTAGIAYRPTYKLTADSAGGWTWGANQFNITAGFSIYDVTQATTNIYFQAYQGGGNPGWICYNGPYPSSLIAFPPGVTDYGIFIDLSGTVTFRYSTDNRATFPIGNILYTFPDNRASALGSVPLYPVMIGGGASLPTTVHDPKMIGGTAY